MTTSKIKPLTLDDAIEAFKREIHAMPDEGVETPLRVTMGRDSSWCAHCELSVVSTGVRKPLNLVFRGGKPAVMARNTAFTDQATGPEALSWLIETKNQLGSGDIPFLLFKQGKELQHGSITQARFRAPHYSERLSRGGGGGILIAPAAL